MLFFKRLFGRKEKQTREFKEDVGLFETYSHKQLGFTFDYPKGWYKGFSGGELFVRPSDAKTISVFGEIIFSPCITMLTGERAIEKPAQFFKDFLSEQSKNFEEYKLLWDHPFKLSTGEEALEWSFEFVKGSYHFIAVSVMAVKHDKTFLLDGSCLNSQFETLEPTLRNVIRSFSLSKFEREEEAEAASTAPSELPEIEFFAFKSDQAIVLHIAEELRRSLPHHVLIIGPGAAVEFSIEEFKKSIPKKYRVLVNRECSVHWLTETMDSLRRKPDLSAVVISNFPSRFEDIVEVMYWDSSRGHCVIRVPGDYVLLPYKSETMKISAAIFWTGVSPNSYLQATNRYYFKGREGFRKFHCLVKIETSAGGLTDREALRLRKTPYAVVQARLLRDISIKMDSEPNVDWFGGILLG